MNKAEILVGNSGAGKSTLAKKRIAENHRLVVISKDAIRKGLIGTNTFQGYWSRNDSQDLEHIVKRTMKTMIDLAYDKRYDIIIDNTNICHSDLLFIMSLMYNRFDYKFTILHISPEAAKERIIKRDNLDDSTQYEFIDHYHNNFLWILEYIKSCFAGKYEEINQ